MSTGKLPQRQLSGIGSRCSSPYPYGERPGGLSGKLAELTHDPLMVSCRVKEKCIQITENEFLVTGPANLCWRWIAVTAIQYCDQSATSTPLRTSPALLLGCSCRPSVAAQDALCPVRYQAGTNSPRVGPPTTNSAEVECEQNSVSKPFRRSQPPSPKLSQRPPLRTHNEQVSSGPEPLDNLQHT